jgi:thioredoxin-related protein
MATADRGLSTIPYILPARRRRSQDSQPQVAAKYKALARVYGGIGVPNVLFMTSNGKKARHIVGYYDAKRLLSALNSVLKSSK